MGRMVAVLAGVLWLGALAVFAVAIQWTSQPRTVPALPTVPPLVRELNAARSPTDGPVSTWTVTRATSAHNALVVDVRAEDVEYALTIAEQIVKPVIDRDYDEILIYVYEANSGKQFADRRVQWTPGRGYSELVLGD